MNELTACDLTGVLVLVYATVAAVWTLCEAGTTARLRALADERPSALPSVRR